MASSDDSADPGRPVHILFVCLSNICRSTMAEGAFRNLTKFGTSNQHPLIASIDSCGTGAYHAGDSPDSRTMSVLKENGITGYRHKARKVTLDDFKKFDYVLGMDADNVIDLRDLIRRGKTSGKLTGEEVEKVRLYGSFGGKSADKEVVDPYYGGRNGFEVAYEQMTRFGQGLLKHIELEAAKELGSSAP